MARFAETLTAFLIPQAARRYWTFRNATIIVLLATVAAACVRAFVSFSPEYVARVELQSKLHSPPFFVLYYALVAVVLWLTYATRHQPGWYQLRVLVFGMFLAGALIGIVDILLPLRSR